MDLATLKAHCDDLIRQGEAVIATNQTSEPIRGVIAPIVNSVDNEMSGEWGALVVTFMAAAFGKEDEFYAKSLAFTKNAWETGLAKQLLALLRAATKRIDMNLVSTSAGKLGGLEEVVLLCERFHSIVRQLRTRHENRPTLDVDDEYDVQDLLHGLLRIYFEDIRPEEWAPSYAGGATRMDFLLAAERLVVETKMGRTGLNAKKVGEQLIVDIAKYKKHPDCGQLVCFVYDPGGHVGNPAAIERDLSRTYEGIPVVVLVRPKH